MLPRLGIEKSVVIFFIKKSELEARLNGTQRALANKPNSFLINLEKKLRDDYLLILNQEA